MRRALLAIALPLVAAGAVSPSPAQEPAEAGLAAMQAISFLVGRWEGEGWMRRGAEDPVRFSSSEHVESRLDGRVLIVEGLHHDATTKQIAHHALAVISFDPATGGYRFRSHLVDREGGDYAAELADGAFVWGFETGNGGRVRYVIRVADERWQEIGEYSADGATWSQFFEMNLRRVAGG
jgi:hypothetical protein